MKLGELIDKLSKNTKEHPEILEEDVIVYLLKNNVYIEIISINDDGYPLMIVSKMY